MVDWINGEEITSNLLALRPLISAKPCIRFSKNGSDYSSDFRWDSSRIFTVIFFFKWGSPKVTSTWWQTGSIGKKSPPIFWPVDPWFPANHPFLFLKKRIVTDWSGYCWNNNNVYGITKKLVRLTGLTLSNIWGRIKAAGSLSTPFTINNSLSKRDALWCIIFNFALKKIVRNAEVGHFFPQLYGQYWRYPHKKKTTRDIKTAFNHISQRQKP